MAVNVQIVDQNTGQLLGTVDGSSADAAVHPGAVYVHQGAEFLVSEWDEGEGVALVRRAAVDVTSQVTSFQRRRKGSGEVLATVALELPPRVLTTASAWFSVPGDLLEDADLAAADVPGALHAAEHAMISLLPLLAMCGRWDLGGLSTAWHPHTEQATIFVHDAVRGGAGFSERGFDSARTWLQMTADLLADCPCTSGCPRCIQSPKCGNSNEPLFKACARALLRASAPARERSCARALLRAVLSA